MAVQIIVALIAVIVTLWGLGVYMAFKEVSPYVIENGRGYRKSFFERLVDTFEYIGGSK